MTKEEIDRVVELVSRSFCTFGGGRVVTGNPIAHALKDHPPQFAAGVDVEDVVRSVISYVERKRHADAQNSTDSKGVDLDQLQEKIRKLLSLLHDRQPGLMTWNMFMR